MMKGDNNKIILAMLAGASAGIIAGLLMATESGADFRRSIGRAARRIGDDLDNTVKDYMNRIGGGALGSDSLTMKGSWDEVKGRLKKRYSDLTDDDLVYAEGGADQLVGNLQRKLGMSSREIREMLADI